MALSNYFENKIIDFLFRGGTYTPPSRLYIALCTEIPTASDTGSTITEVSGGNYSRRGIYSNHTSWNSTQGDESTHSTGTSGTTSNVNSIVWSGITWEATVVAVAICDDPSTGNLIYFQSIESKNFRIGTNVNFRSTNFVVRFS